MRTVLLCWLLLAALAVPLTASAARDDNGVGSLTPGQILARLQHDVAGAKSVHVYGSGTSGGDRIALNLRLAKGRGGSGHIAEGAVAFNLVRVGKRAYFKAGVDFWSQFTKSKGLQQLFAGKWLSASATKGDLASFTPLTDIQALTKQIVTKHGKLEKGPTTSVNGHPAIELVDTTDGGILYVSTHGPAYPLLLKPGKDQGAGQIVFGEWDKPVKLVAPAKSIDYDTMSH